MEIPVTQDASLKTSQYKQGFDKDNNCDGIIMLHDRRRQISRTYSTRTLHLEIITFFLVIFASFAVAGSCPSQCSCSTESVAFCNNEKLLSVPTDFTSVVEKLYLFNNNITTIPPEALQPMKNLKLLDLSGNRITNYALWEGIFSQLKLLENLMLQENQITRIRKDMFKGLTNLARIYLQDNHITYIEDGAFDSLPNLVELKLRKNRLISFPRIQHTPNLLLLDLGFNRLRTIRDLALSTVNLEYLKLQSNELTQLRTSIFDDTSRLTQLDISDNRLTAVPVVIKSFTSLRALNMSLNKVGSIPSDTFKGMTRLKTLDLHRMGLKALPYGIIPRKVILNVLDITENDFDCECSVHWLPQYIRIFEQAFVTPNMIKCSVTSKLSERKMKDLRVDDFGCTEEELERPLLPEAGSTTTKATTPPKTTNKPWVPNPCDVFPCFNEGQCYISGNHPRCRCARGFYGSQCKKSFTRPTTSTTTRRTLPTTTKRNHQVETTTKPQLLINPDSITEHSVEIILPQTKTELVLSVTEIGKSQNPKEITITPMAHPFTVMGLESGKSYNICIHLPLLGRRDNLPSYIDNTDTLCGSVRTEGIRVVNTHTITTKITVVPSPGVVGKDEDTTEHGEKVPGKYEPGKGDKQQGNPNTTPSENTDFKIIYPAVGAGIGAIIITGVVIMFIFCYRRRRMQKLKSQGNADYIPGSPMDGTQLDMEMATVVHHHHHNHYNAGGVEPNNTPSSGGKKQNAHNKKNKKNSFTNNNSAPKSVTPNKTSSLGRSSNTSGSSGTLQSRYVDTPQSYPPKQQQQYISPSPPNHPAYEALPPPQRNARGNEYIYRNHQNNNNSAMQIPNGHCMPIARSYEPEIMDDMQPLVGGMNQYTYRQVDTGQMYPDGYPMSPREYIPQVGPVSYPQTNSRSAFQPIQSPRKNTVHTPTSESGPITTHVNTAHVLPTSTCLNRNLMSENLIRYQEGVPVV